MISSLRGLIVSCQAPVGSPLREPVVIAALAEAACLSGAVGVRIESPEHVRAVRGRIDKPIVGLWKRDYAGFEVYITPTFADAEAIAEAGADIIAIDGTARARPNGEMLPELIRRIHVELQKPVLADIATLAEAEAAVAAGADIVVTTLCGYTAETKGAPLPAFDLLGTMVQNLDLPVWCEGGVSSPEQYAQALRLGAKVVVVGTALTGLEVQVRRYLNAL
ncbi:MAG: N-acetylmannosamine-6-phosphate 2-epimerase [Anaerolineae bacterium]|nr:N-acetylmannosamine-6-phosphate 2-epimerase [Gloeobacterales cyanobacterium ES-bin-313]